MGVKVGLVLTSDVRHQPDQAHHLVGPHNRDQTGGGCGGGGMLYGTKINVSHLSEWS